MQNQMLAPSLTPCSLVICCLQLDLEDGPDFGPSPFMSAAAAGGAASQRAFSGGRSGAPSGASTPRTNNRSPSGALSRLFTRLFSSSRETSTAAELTPEATGAAANGMLDRGSAGGVSAFEEGDGRGDLAGPAGPATAAGAGGAGGIFAHRSFSGEVPWSDWEIDPSDVELMKRPDGSTWELGSGGFGRVYKALRNGAQVVAVKVIPVSGRWWWWCCRCRCHCCCWTAGGAVSCRSAPHARQRTPPLMAEPAPPLILAWLRRCRALQSHGSTRQAALLETRKEIAILRACRDPNIVMFQVSPAERQRPF